MLYGRACPGDSRELHAGDVGEGAEAGGGDDSGSKAVWVRGAAAAVRVLLGCSLAGWATYGLGDSADDVGQRGSALPA